MYVKKYTDTSKNIMTISSVYVILFQIFVVGSMNLCSNFDGTFGCCKGYKLDRAQNTCIPCDAGFTGINCDAKCQYPSFGNDCQSLCDCSATYCDHVNGCKEASENHQIQFTMHMNYKNVTKEHMVKDNVINGESTSNVTDNTTTYYTYSCYTKEPKSSSRIRSLMFAVIGLTTVSFFMYIMYLYIRVLENRQTNTNAFTG